MSGFERILIIKMSAIGDVVHTLPFAEVLRRNHPRARIDWLVEEAAHGLIAGHWAIDRIFVSRRKTWPRMLRRPATAGAAIGEILLFVQALREDRYDLAVDLQGLLKSGLWLGASRARRKIGLSGAREGALLFTSEPPVPVDYERHAIDRTLDVALHLGCRPVPWEGRIPVGVSEEERVSELLAARAGGPPRPPIVAINPMARWASKLWVPERFAALADRLALDHGCSVVFTGSRGDRPALEAMGRRMRARALNLAGQTTLKELAALLSRAAVLVCTDTGPMHIAAAMKCPVVALFGPTAPSRTGPYGGGHQVVQAAAPCAPCFRKSCDDRRCMRAIEVEQVLEAVRRVLAENIHPQPMER